MGSCPDTDIDPKDQFRRRKVHGDKSLLTVRSYRYTTGTVV